MILPPVVRVFFAIAFPKDITEKLAQYIDGLRQHSRSNKIRWTRPENLHITLQFLAEVQGADIPGMLKSVQQEMLPARHPLQFKLSSLHLFPDPHRPRVLVIDVAPQEALAEWAALIGKGIQNSGYDIESRPFRPHLSIGRIKTVQTTALSFLQNAEPLHLPTLHTDEVTLFQSVPQPDGSHYIPLARLVPGEFKI